MSLFSSIGNIFSNIGQTIGGAVSSLPQTIQAAGKGLARTTKDGIRFISPVTGALVKVYSAGEKFTLSPVGKLFDATLVKWDILPPHLTDAIVNITAVPKRFVTTGDFNRAELSKALRGATALAVAPAYGSAKRTSSYIATGKSKFGLVRTLDKYSGGILTASETIDNFQEKVAEQKTLKTQDWVGAAVSALKVVAAVSTGGGSIVSNAVSTGLTDKTNLDNSIGGKLFIASLSAAAGTATASYTGAIPQVDTEQLFAKSIGDAAEAGAQQGTSKYLGTHTFLKNSKTGQVLAISLGQAVGKTARVLSENLVSSIANFNWDAFDSSNGLPDKAMAKEIATKTAENAAAYEAARKLREKGVNISGEELSNISERIRKSDPNKTWQQRTAKEINRFVEKKFIEKAQEIANKKISEEARKILLDKLMAQLDRMIRDLYGQAFDLINQYGVDLLTHLMAKYGLYSDYSNLIQPEDYYQYQITVNRINNENGRLFSYNNYNNPNPLPYVGVALLGLLGTTYMVV